MRLLPGKYRPFCMTPGKSTYTSSLLSLFLSASLFLSLSPLHTHIHTHTHTQGEAEVARMTPGKKIHANDALAAAAGK